MFVTEEDNAMSGQMQMLQAMIYYLVNVIGGSFVFDFADLEKFMNAGYTFMVADVTNGFAIKVEKPVVETTEDKALEVE